MKSILYLVIASLFLFSCNKSDLATYQVTSGNGQLSIKYIDESGEIKTTSVFNTEWSYTFEAKKKDKVYLEINSASQNNTIKGQIFYKNKQIKTSENSGGMPSLILEGTL